MIQVISVGSGCFRPRAPNLTCSLLAFPIFSSLILYFFPFLVFPQLFIPFHLLFALNSSAFHSFFPIFFPFFYFFFFIFFFSCLTSPFHFPSLPECVILALSLFFLLCNPYHPTFFPFSIHLILHSSIIPSCQI